MNIIFILDFNISFFKEHMDKGNPKSVEGMNKWVYPNPNSGMEKVLKSVSERYN